MYILFYGKKIVKIVPFLIKVTVLHADRLKMDIFSDAKLVNRIWSKSGLWAQDH